MTTHAMDEDDARHAEAAILGCLLSADASPDNLRLDWFEEPAHVAVAEAIRAVHQSGRPVDFGGVCAWITKHNKVPGQDVVNLVNSLFDERTAPSLFDRWRKLLEERANLRRVQETARATLDEVGKAPDARTAARLLAECHAQTAAVSTADDEEADFADNRELLRRAIERLEHRVLHPDELPGLGTGFADLDHYIGGMRPGMLLIIAGRPSSGKTSLAMNIGAHLGIDQKIPVGFFSLEMPSDDLMDRIIAGRSGVDLHHARKLERSDLPRLVNGQAGLPDSKLFIDDRPMLTPELLAERAKRLVTKHGVRLLVLDYLGLLTSPDRRQSRYEQVSSFSNSLKRIAKECAVPFIVCAQLNRASEREDRPPYLSDLRDSGAIEQDADLVALVHRKDDRIDWSDRDILIAKNRNGPCGKVSMLFRGPTFKFLPAERREAVS